MSLTAFATPSLVIGILGGLISIAIGALLLVIRPRRSGITGFAVYSVVVGAQLALNRYGDAALTGAPAILTLNWPLMGLCAVSVIIAVDSYLGLSSRVVAAVFMTLTMAGVVIFLIDPATMVYPDGGPNDLGVILWQMPFFLGAAVACIQLARSLGSRSHELGIETLLLLVALLPHLGYTSVVSILVAFTSPGAIFTMWGWAYILTFGVCILTTLGIAAVLWQRSGRWETRLSALAILALFAGALQFYLFPQFLLFGGAFRILAALLLGYGLLKFTLFGIDLKLKWTLDKGALLAIFGGVFFLVDQAAQYFVSDAYGLVAGVVAALLMILALAPLRKFTHRLVDRAMPTVQDSPEYFSKRRITIYRAAAQSAARDGRITDDERSMLDALRDEMGLAPDEARAVERDVLIGVPSS